MRSVPVRRNSTLQISVYLDPYGICLTFIFHADWILNKMMLMCIGVVGLRHVKDKSYYDNTHLSLVYHAVSKLSG